MINLLPPQQKKEIANQKKFRLVLILGILGVFFVVSTSLILFGVNQYLSAKLKQKEVLLQEKEEVIASNRHVEEEIQQANTVLANLNSFYQDNLRVGPVFQVLYDLFPSETYLTNLSFSVSRVRGREKGQEKEVGSISMSGYSPSRDSLLEFKKRLEEEPSFKRVYFSPTSWVQPTDVEFSVNFDLKKIESFSDENQE